MLPTPHKTEPVMVYLVLLLCLTLVSANVEGFDEFEVEAFGEDDEDLVVGTTANTEPEFDEDEFESLKYTPPKDTQGKAHPKPPSAPPMACLAFALLLTPKPKDFWTLVTTYWMECFCIIFLICYAINFYFGQKQNENIVKDWGVTYQELFMQNFAKV